MSDQDQEMDMAAAMAADNEKDMAAAMEGEDASPEGASIAEASSSQATRVLNQDEIDSLLGFDMDSDGGNENSGIKAIINSALVNYERLPMLEVVFYRLVRMMTTSLRNFTSDNVEVSLDTITSIRFGDYLNSIPLPAILSVFCIISSEATRQPFANRWRPSPRKAASPPPPPARSRTASSPAVAQTKTPCPS